MTWVEQTLFTNCIFLRNVVVVWEKASMVLRTGSEAGMVQEILLLGVFLLYVVHLHLNFAGKHIFWLVYFRR